MIDLHMHTQYSDGSETCTTVLKKCEEKKLDYISITDHNTTEVYEELKNIDIKQYYTNKIIPGVELNTKVLNIPIEILGYGIDYKKMNKLTKSTYISTTERNLIEVQRLYEKCIDYNIVLDRDCLNRFDVNNFASVFFHKEITKHEQNKKLIDEEAWGDSKIFYRKYMSDPQTPLYIEMDDLVPDFITACNLVKQAGGLVFLPHIFEYRRNAEKILVHILRNYKIDGIECYYTTFSEEQTNKVLNICKERNLFISGGSDFHGKSKPDVEIGIGHGNLTIPTDIIKPWIGKINLY